MNDSRSMLSKALEEELSLRSPGLERLSSLDPRWEAAPPRIPGDDIPIPESRPVAGWKDVPVSESNERLRPLGPFAGILWGRALPYVDSTAAYFGEHGSSLCFVGHEVDRRVSLLSPFLRESPAAELTNLAAELLRGRVTLTVYDAYRPLPVQRAIFDAFMQILAKARPELDAEALIVETQTYVSLPSPNASTRHASPHVTGGAVDLGLSEISPTGMEVLAEDASGAFRRIDLDFSLLEPVLRPAIEEAVSLFCPALEVEPIIETFRISWLPELPSEMARLLVSSRFLRPLDMGCPFDYFGAEARTAHFEGSGGRAERNRRSLFHLLAARGFSNYEEEWWHFSMGDGMSAGLSDSPTARYHVAELGSREQVFEILRRAVWRAFPRFWSPR